MLLKTIFNRVTEYKPFVAEYVEWLIVIDDLGFINLATAGDTADSTLNVDCMVEICVFGELVHLSRFQSPSLQTRPHRSYTCRPAGPARCLDGHTPSTIAEGSGAGAKAQVSLSTFR